MSTAPTNPTHDPTRRELFREWLERVCRDLFGGLRDMLYAFGRATKEIILDPREGVKNRTTYIFCAMLALVAVIYLCRHPDNWEHAVAAAAAAGGIARSRAAVNRNPYGSATYVPPPIHMGGGGIEPEFPDGIPGEQEW